VNGCKGGTEVTAACPVHPLGVAANLIATSGGNVGDSHGNGLDETKAIWGHMPWKSLESIAFAILQWVDGFNHRSCLEPIRNIPPSEAEQRYLAARDQIKMAASFNPKASGKPGAFQIRFVTYAHVR